MEIDGLVSSQFNAFAGKRHVIGPVAESSFWNGERKGFGGIRGPCKEICVLSMISLIAIEGTTPEDYVKAIANREIAWFETYTNTIENPGPFQAASQKFPEAHVSLYERLMTAADHLLPQNPELTGPTL